MTIYNKYHKFCVKNIFFLKDEDFLGRPGDESDGCFGHRQGEQNAHFIRETHKVMILGMLLGFLMLCILL